MLEHTLQMCSQQVSAGLQAAMGQVVKYARDISTELAKLLDLHGWKVPPASAGSLLLSLAGAATQCAHTDGDTGTIERWITAYSNKQSQRAYGIGPVAALLALEACSILVWSRSHQVTSHNVRHQLPCERKHLAAGEVVIFSLRLVHAGDLRLVGNCPLSGDNMRFHTYVPVVGLHPHPKPKTRTPTLHNSDGDFTGFEANSTYLVDESTEVGKALLFSIPSVSFMPRDAV